MEAKDDHLTMQPVELGKRGVHALTVFNGRQRFKRAGIAGCNLEGAVAVAIVLKRLKTGGCLPARVINHQVTGDGEEPSVKLRLAVILRAALQDSHPGFLK